MRTLLALLVTGLAASAMASAGEAPPAFTAKPTAAKAGDKVKIEFAADRETDAAVYVLDAQGKCVRHLVAGVIGGKGAPPEPFKSGLAQSVEWDGQDDAGKPAAGGPFKVRVALGLKPEFDSFVLHNPDGSGITCALAVGPGGTLYVFHLDGTCNGNMGGHKIKVYNRDGKHLKVLVPFPADIAPERVKALGVFQDADGALVPHLYNYEQLSCYPDPVTDRGRSLPTGIAPAVDSKGRVYWIAQGPMLCAVDADGGIPYETFLGPKLPAGLAGRPCLAMSSDDRYVYVSSGSSCVYRVDVATRAAAEPFVGKPGQPGSEKESLSSARGLAVAKGLLYVADYRADRVAVFKESDRSYVGEIKVKAPDTLGVDPATDAVYVCSAAKVVSPDIVKFDGYQNGRELYRITPPRTGDWAKEPEHHIVVDASARPVRVWMPAWPYSPKRLFCFEDAGDKFVDKGDPRSKDLWAEGPRDLSVDRLRDEVYVKGNWQKYYRLDDKTGKLKDTVDLGSYCSTVPSTQLLPGTDGNLYTQSWGTGLWRFDRQGKPLKWDGYKSANIPLGGIMCFQERHMALRPYAPPDELYLVPSGNYLDEKARMSDTVLNVFGQDGKARRTVVWQCSHGAIPKVDPKGNVYLADLVKPPGRSYPEFFDGKLAAPPKEAGGGDLFWNSYVYASIVKFPPAGGIIWYRKNLPPVAVGAPPAELLAKPKVPINFHWGYSLHLSGELQGALWYRFGFAPFSAHTSGMTSHCMCEGAGFDVDDFGRVFYPNSGQFRVEVVDTNNNWITTFGRYGNEDSGGPAAKVKKPEIPLAWPCYVAVSDSYAYVADTVNRRTVKVKLGSAAEETCEVR